VGFGYVRIVTIAGFHFSGPAWLRLLVAAAVVLLATSAGCGGHSAGAGGAGSAAQTGSSTGAGASIHPPAQVIRAGDNPHDIAVVSGHIWVADFGSPVQKFDLHGRHLRTIPASAQSLAAGPNTVWVGELSNSNRLLGKLAQIDAISGRRVRTFATEDAADEIAVGAGAVWTASHFAARITRIALPSGAQRTFPLPGNPTAIGMGHGAVWVAFAQPESGNGGVSQAVGEPQTGSGGVVQLDPSNGSQLSTQSEQTVPTALLVTGGSVWVSLANDLNEVDRLDARSGQSRSTIRVGKQPTELAFGDGSVWALNYSDATVTRIDAASDQVSATITFAPPTDPDRLAANTPIRLAVTPGTLWVTDAQANILRRLPER
jgi:hypothetical protein